MGKVSHLCSSPLPIVAPTYFTAASLDDTPGEQMCSNKFTESSDMREMVFHYFPVILLRAKSSAVQREFQSPGTNHFKVFAELNSMYQTTEKHMSIHYYAN